MNSCTPISNKKLSMTKHCLTLSSRRRLATLLASLILPVLSHNAGAQTTNSNVLISFTISSSLYGTPGYTNGFTSANPPTNSLGILTNAAPFANNNLIVYSNSTSSNAPLVGVSDTAMTIYGFASKSTTSTKGFATYQNGLTVSTSTNVNPVSGSNYAIGAAPSLANEAQAIAMNSIVTWNITVSTGFNLVLTNASGWIDNASSGNGVSNWGFVFSTNATFTNGCLLYTSPSPRD